jgi:hypothetical protein
MTADELRALLSERGVRFDEKSVQHGLRSTANRVKRLMCSTAERCLFSENRIRLFPRK